MFSRSRTHFCPQEGIVPPELASPATVAFEPKTERMCRLDCLVHRKEIQNWETIEVPAGKKRELSATYVIRVPVSYELVGGNRREG